MRYGSTSSTFLVIAITICFAFKISTVESRLYNVSIKSRKSSLISPSSSSAAAAAARLLIPKQNTNVCSSSSKRRYNNRCGQPLAFVQQQQQQNYNRLTLSTTTRSPKSTLIKAAVTDSNFLLNWSLRLTSAVVTYVGLVAWLDRPRGHLLLPATLPSSTSLVNDDSSNDSQNACLRVAPSRVPGAGLGLFANCSLPKNTRLGSYPGVLVPIRMHSAKLRAFPQCEYYTWRFSDNEYVLDPTDARGNLGNTCIGGNPNTPFSVWLFENILSKVKIPPSVPTTLCRINEPPKGYDVNVITREFLNNRTVAFTLERDVVQGEELFMDYGLYYDRSMYGRAANKIDVESTITTNTDKVEL